MHMRTHSCVGHSMDTGIVANTHNSIKIQTRTHAYTAYTQAHPRVAHGRDGHGQPTFHAPAEGAGVLLPNLLQAHLHGIEWVGGRGDKGCVCDVDKHA